MDVERRITQLEARLKQEVDNREAFESDMKDQQEAMDALMDMLEKTITEDDTHDLLDAQKDELLERLSSLDSSVQEIRQEYHDLDTKLENTGVHIVKRVEKLRSDLQAEDDQLDAKIEALDVSVKESITRVSTRLDERLEEAGTEHNKDLQALNGTLATVQQTLGKHIEALENDCGDQIDGLKAELNDTMIKMQATNDSSAEKLRKQMNAAIDSLSHKLRQDMNVLNTNTNRATERIDAQLGSSMREMRQDLTSVEKSGEQRVVELQSRLTSEAAEIRKQLNTELSAINLRVSTQLEKAHTHQADDTQRLELHINRFESQLNSTAQALKTECCDQLDKLELLVNQIEAEGRGRVTEQNTLIGSLEERQRSLEHKAQSDQNVSQAAIRRVAVQLNEAKEILDSEIKERFQELDGRCDSISADLKAADDKQIEEARDKYNELQLKCSRNEEQVAATSTELSSMKGSLDLTIAENLRTSEARCEIVDQQIEQLKVEHAELIEQNLKIATSRCDNVELKVTGELQSLKEQLSKKAEELSKKAEELSKKAEERFQKLNTDMHRQKDDASKEISELRKECTDALEKAKEGLNRKDAEQDNAIAQLEPQVHNFQEQDLPQIRKEIEDLAREASGFRVTLSETCRSIELTSLDNCQKLSERLDKLDGSVQRNNQGISECKSHLETVGTLDRRLSTALDDVQSAVEADKRGFSEKLGELKATSESNYDHFKKMFEDVDHKLRTNYDETEARLKVQSEKLTTVEDTLRNKFEMFRTEQTENLKNDHARLLQRLTDLQSRIEDTDKDQKEKMEEIKETVAKNQEYSSNLVDEIHGKLDDHLNKHDGEIYELRGSINQNHKQVTDDVKDLDSRFRQETAAQKERTEKLEKDLTGRCDKLMGTQSESSEDLQDRLTTLSDTVSKLHKDFVVAQQDLPKKLELQAKAQEQLLRKSQDELDGKYTALVEDTKTLKCNSNAQFEQFKTSLKQLGDKMDAAIEKSDRGCLKLAERLAQQADSHESRIQLQQVEFTNQCRALESYVGDQVAEWHLKVDTESQRLEERCESIERGCKNLQAKLEKSATEINESIRGNHDQLTGLHGEIEKKIEAQDKALTLRVDNCDNRFQASIAEANDTFKTATAGTNERIVDLLKTMRENDKKLTDECRKLKEQSTVCVRAQDALTRSLDDRVSEVRREIDQRATEVKLARDTQITGLQGTLQDHNQRLNESIESMESKLEGTMKIHDESLQSMCTELKGQIKELGDRFCDEEQDARIDRLEAAINKHRDHLTNLDGQIQDELAEASRKTEVRIRTHHNHFTEAVAQLNTRTEAANKVQNEWRSGIESTIETNREHGAELVKQLDEKFAKDHKTHDDKVTALDERFTAQCADLAKRFKFDAIESRLEDIGHTVRTNHEYFSKVCAEQDVKFQSLHDEQQIRIEDQRKDFAGVSAELAKKFRLFMEYEHEHFTDVCRAIDKRVTEKVYQFDSELADIRNVADKRDQHHTELCKDVDRHFTHVCEEMGAKYDAHNAGHCERFEDMSKHFLDICANMDKVYEDRKSLQDEQAANRHKDSTETIQRLQEQTTQLIDELASAKELQHRAQGESEANLTAYIVSVKDTHTSRMDELNQRLQADRQHFIELNAKLEQTTEEQFARLTSMYTTKDETTTQDIASVKAHIANQHDNFTDKCNFFDQKFAEITSTMDSNVEDQRLRLRDVSQGLDTKLSQKDAAQDKQLDAIRQIADKNQQQLTDVCESLARRLDAKATQQDGRMDELHDAIDSNHQHFTEISKTLDKKFREENAAQNERTVETLQALMGRCDALEQNTTDNLAAHDDSLKSHYDHFTDVCSNINTKFTERCEASESSLDDAMDTVARHKDHFTDVCAGLDEKFTTKNSDQDSLISSHYGQLSELIATSRLESESRDAAQETRLETLTTALKEQHQHFTEATETVDKRSSVDAASIRASVARLAQQNEAQEKRLDGVDSDMQETRTQFAASCAALRQSFTAENAAQDEQMVKDRETAAEATATVQLNLSEKLNEQATLVSALRDQQHVQHEQHVDICSRLDQKFTSFNEDRKKVTQTQREHFTNVVATLEKRLSEKNAELDVRTDNLRVAITELHEDLQSRCSGLQDSLRDAVGTLETKIADERSHCTIECEKLERRFEQYNSEQDGRLDGLRNTVQANLEQLVDDNKSLDTKFTHTNADQKSLFDNLQEKLTSRCAHLDKTLSDSSESLDARIKAIATQVETYYGEHSDSIAALGDQVQNCASQLTSQIQDQHKQFTDSCAAVSTHVDSQATAQHGLIEEIRAAVTEQHDLFTDVVNNLRVRLDARNSTQDERTESIFVHFTEACAGLDKKWSSSIAEQDLRVQSLNDEVLKNHHFFSDLCSQLKQEIQDGDGALDETLKGQHQHFTDLCDELDRAAAEASAEHSQRMDDLKATIDKHHEMLTKTCSSLDARHTQEAEAQKALMDQQHAHIMEMYSTLERSLMQANVAQDVRIDEVSAATENHHQHFTDLCATLDEKLVEELAGVSEQAGQRHEELLAACDSMDKKCTQQTSDNATRMEGLSGSIREHQQHFADLYESLDIKFTNICAAHDARFESQQQQYTELCSNADQKFSERMENHRELFRDMYDSLDKKCCDRGLTHEGRMDEFAATILEHHRHFTSVIATSDKKFTRSAEGHDARLESQEAHFTKMCSALDERLSEKIVSEQQRLTGLTGQVEEHHRHFTIMCDTLDTKASELKATMLQRSEEQHNLFSGLCADMSSRIREDTAELSTKLNAVEKNAAEQQAHFTSICDGLDGKFTETYTTLDERILQLKDHTTDVCSSMDAKFTEADAAQNERMEIQNAELISTCERLDMEIKSSLEQRDARLDEISGATQHDYKHCVDMCSKLDATLTEKIEAQDERIDDLSATVDSNQATATVAVEQLDAKLTADNKQQDEAFEASREHLANLIVTLEDTLGVEKARMLDAAAELESKQTVRMDQIDANMQQQQEHFTHVCAQLDQQSGERHAAHEALIQHHHGHFNDACAAMEEKFTEIHKSHTQRTESDSKQMVDLYEVLDQKLGQETTRLDHKFAEMIGNMDQRLTSKAQSQDERLDDHHQHVAALQSEVTKHIDAESASLDEKFVEICTKLDRKLTDTNGAVTSRVDQCYRHFNDLCAEIRATSTDSVADINRQLLDRSTAASERMDEQSRIARDMREHLDDQCAALERRITEAQVTQDSRVENVQSNLSAMCTQLESKITSQNADLDARIESERSERVAAHAKLDSRLADTALELDRKAIEELTALRDSVTDQHTSLRSDVQQQHDHLTQVFNSLDKRLSAEMDRICKDFASNHQDHATLLAELGSTVARNDQRQADAVVSLQHAMSSEQAVSTERAESHHKHFTAVCSKLDAKFVAICGDLDKRLSDAAAAHSGAVDKMQCANHNLEQHFTKVCEGIDAKFCEKIAAQDAHIDDHYGHFSQVCSELHTTFTDESHARDGLIEEHHKHFTAVCGNMDKKFSEANTTLDALFSDTCARMKEQLSEDIERNSARLDTEHQHFTDICYNLDQRVGQSTTQVNDLVAQLCGNLDEKLSSYNQQQDERIEAHHSHFTQVCATLNEKFGEATELLESRLTEASAAYSERADSMQVTIDEHHARLTSAIADVNSRSHAKSGDMEEVIEDHHKHFTAVCIRLDKKFTEEKAMQDEVIEDHHKHFTNVCANVDRKFSDECANLHDKFTDKCAQLELHFSEKNASQDRRTEIEHEHFTEVCTNLDSKFSDAVAELDEKFTDKDASHAVRLEELTASLSEHHDYFTDVCYKMDKKLKEKDEAQDELIEQNARDFTSLCTKLDTQLSDTCTQLDRRLTDRTDAHESRLDELTLSAKSQHAQVTKELHSFDKKFTAKETVLAEQIEEHHKLFTDLCTRLDSKCTSTSNELNDRIGAENQHFSNVCDGLQRKLTIEMAAMEKRTEEARAHGEDKLAAKATTTSQELSAQTRQLADDLLDLETKLTDTTSEADRKLAREIDSHASQLAALTEKLQKVNEHFTDVCYGLDKTGTTLAQSMAEKVENTRQQSINATTALDHKFIDLIAELRQALVEKNGVQDARTDEVNRAVQQHYEHFTDLTTKMAKRHADKDAEQDRLIEANRAQASEALSSVHRRMKEDNDKVMNVVIKDYEVLTAKTAELDRAGVERNTVLDQNFSEAVRALEMKLTAVEQAQNERVANEHTRVTGQFQKLEQQLEGMGFAQDKKAKELNADALQKMSQIAKDLGDQLDSIRQHFSSVTSSMAAESSAGDAELESKFAEICSKLDRKFIDKCAVIDEHVQQNFKELSSMCGVLDQASLERNAETKSALSLSLAELQKTLDSKNEEQDCALDVVKKQGDDSVAKLSASTIKLYSELEQKVMADREANQKELSARGAALDDRIEAEHKLFTDIISKLDWKTSEATDNVEEKFTATCTMLKNQTEELDAKQTDACERISATLASLSTDLQADVKQRHDVLLSAHEKLTQETQNASLKLASTIDGNLEPKLAETATVARNAISKLETIETRLSMEQLELKTEVEADLEAMRTEIDKVTDTLNGMTPALDVNALLMGAASGEA